MLHKKLLRIILVLLLAFTSVMTSFAQDDADPVLILTVLSDGDVIEAELSEDVQSMLYVFNANAGDVVTVSMVQTDELDPVLVMLAPNGHVVATNDDSGNGTSSLLDAIEIPETGSYFLIATSFSSFLVEEFVGDPQGYVLTIEGNTFVEEIGDAFNFVADVLADDAPALIADISEEQAGWLFTFSGSAGDVVSLTAESADFDTLLLVFGPGGSRITVSDDVDAANGDTNSAIEGLVLPEDGVYLVMVGNPFLYYYGVETVAPDDLGEFVVELVME